MTEDGVKYRRKFYDYNYAQGTLVPYRTVLWANDKQIEETEYSEPSLSVKRSKKNAFNRKAK